MSFWQDPNLEPKRAYRFVLSIPGGATQGIKQYLVKSVTKPSFTVNSENHKYLNHTFHYPGSVEWNEVSFVIVDTIDDDSNGTADLMKILEDSGYELPTTPQGPETLGTISKKKAVQALGQISIKTIDSEGNNVESWVLNNAWVTNAEFGDLSYDSDELLNISVSVRYDNAYVNVVGKGKIPLTSGAN